jgi:hypothetical protein
MLHVQRKQVNFCLPIGIARNLAARIETRKRTDFASPLRLRAFEALPPGHAAAAHFSRTLMFRAGTDCKGGEWDARGEKNRSRRKVTLWDSPDFPPNLRRRLVLS